MVYLRTIRIRTSKWYSDNISEASQDKFWYDYIRMMYWSQDHVVSMHQKETASELSTLEW